MISVCSLVAVMQIILPPGVQAEFFKYQDSSGGIVLTDKLENVPQKYRKQVKVIWDEELVAKDPYARRKAAAEAQREEQLRQQALQQEKQKGTQGGAGKLQPSDGKTLVIRYDEGTGQLIRTME
ncbi:MAG: hypothetical protein M0T70_13455 [Geobacteraceae bacterium]|nr:hypothetical protein [Geobacteraceae bacterium]